MQKCVTTKFTLISCVTVSSYMTPESGPYQTNKILPRRRSGAGYFYVVYIFYLVMHFIFCVTIEVWQKVRKVVIDSAVKANGVVYKTQACM